MRAKIQKALKDEDPQLVIQGIYSAKTENWKM